MSLSLSRAYEEPRNSWHARALLFTQRTPCCQPNTCREEQQSMHIGTSRRTYTTVYTCWSGAMFGQQIDFACGILIRGAKCIFTASFSTPRIERDKPTSPFLYAHLLALGFLRLALWHFIGLLSFADLSPINNDNNNQRQAQVANTIVNQPAPVILRYCMHTSTHVDVVDLWRRHDGYDEVWQADKRENYCVCFCMRMIR